MQYMIHTCNKRKWYVEQHLVPSMLRQGIKPEDITVWLDDKKLGNLKAWVASCEDLPSTGSTWHLQDDVVISPHFKKLTEKNTDGIICGFASVYCKQYPPGKVGLSQMWYSFPCIHIPNELAHEFVEWYDKIKDGQEYEKYIEKNKYDDSMFMFFLEAEHKGMQITNYSPNLVDNVDYLIGGSLVNKNRSDEVKALYFKDHEVVEQLERKLNGQYRW